ncbi:IDEAL domain-containing protein [Rossellomorea aquimaris]|uniref:IDEAL domain-containing protein n=1 Tax=Rossellomorea TaxID=2837508 RepID=UPI001CD1FCC5|nr:IDEAL domain-containing protein [Rossellomorea aquimaris]MCA1059570.1 IDEAL domain-containing protein [Rossellomorea aquimaris]
MESKKSYTEMMKAAAAINRKKSAERSVMEIYIDMVLHESILMTQKTKLLTDIDAALDTKDKELFMKLTKELNELNISYG